MSNKNSSVLSMEKSSLDVKYLDDMHQNDGRDIMLSDAYVLWTHSINDKNWNMSSYKKICTVKNVSEFWRLFNNFKKLSWKYTHCFLMRDGIDPIWEHPANRFGGICSFKVDDENALGIWEDLNAHLMCNKLANNNDDINGISISPKNTAILIKIWNKNKSIDLTKELTSDILEKYKEVSIKYKTNEPEYEY